MRSPTIKYLNSAGGAVFRRTDDSFEVALIATKNKTVWTLPKGIIDKDENPEETAVREIKEETGLTTMVIDVLGERSFWFFLKDKNIKCKKTVKYFLLEYISGNIEDYGWEVDEARWFDIEDALKLVSYKSDIEILQKAKEKLQIIRDKQSQ